MEGGTKLWRSGVTTARIDERANEDAIRVQRQCCDVRVEVLPVSGAHEQVLLHIRCVEGRDRCAVLFQVLAGRSKRSRAREVSYQRHNQIALFDLLEREEIFFGGEIASLLAVF